MDLILGVEKFKYPWILFRMKHNKSMISANRQTGRARLTQTRLIRSSTDSK